MAMKKCPVCGVSVRAENLERHVRNQHPKEDVDISDTLTEEDQAAIEERKSAARSGITRGGRRMLIIVGLVIAIVLAAIIGSQFLPRKQPVSGSSAPNFSLPSTDGTYVTLSSWRGSPVLIEFMDVDCPFCQQEAPVLSALYQTYSGKGVQFVSLDINFEGAPDTAFRINSFRTNYSTPWPYCLDSGQTVAASYGVSSTPTIFIVKKDGTVYNSYTGVSEASQANLVAALNAVLGG
jgi:peroxiredoxin